MVDHIVIKEKKEVWFKGDYPTCMAYSQIVDKNIQDTKLVYVPGMIFIN